MLNKIKLFLIDSMACVSGFVVGIIVFGIVWLIGVNPGMFMPSLLLSVVIAIPSTIVGTCLVWYLLRKPLAKIEKNAA